VIGAGADVKVVPRLLDRYGHLLNDDFSGVADGLGKAMDSTAVFRPLSDAETA
jgi:hypothetical protein